MKKQLIYSFSFLMAFFSLVKSQNNDTLFIKTKVESIDALDYYIVIHAVSEDNKKLTILSSADDKNSIIENFKCYEKLDVGNEYNFILQKVTRIKNGKNSYLFISLKKFDYNGKPFLDDGELPFLALNTYQYDIYSDCIKSSPDIKTPCPNSGDLESK